MELTALKAEIAKPEYDGLTDAQIAALVNAKTVTRSRLVPNWEIKRHGIANQYWPAIVIAATSGEVPTQVRGVAISARDWIDDRAGEVRNTDLSLPETQMLLGALVLTTLATQEQVDDLLTLGTETVAWTAANDLPEVGPGLVHSARIS